MVTGRPTTRSKPCCGTCGTQRGFDFTGYKRSSLMRRVRHRMDQAGKQNFDEYLDTLQTSTDEFAALFNTILINVTDVLPRPGGLGLRPHGRHSGDCGRARSQRSDPAMERRLRFGAGAVQPWRCCSPRTLGLDAYRQRVKIYATDVDEDALSQARAAALYDAKAVESVPEDLLERYFERSNGRYVVQQRLRRAVIFGRNDLVRDAPISRVDLLACRNTLMYMNGDTQRNVLGRLHFALAPRGVLFLGHAEMLLSHTDRFSPVNMDSRIFRKALGSHTRRHSIRLVQRDDAPRRPSRPRSHSRARRFAPARSPRSW